MDGARPLYNPALLTRQELVASFVARQPQLEELAALVRRAPEGVAPQHALLIGWRGMGKTTLLHRLAHLVADDPELSARWLPVLFDEEQYNVGDLADFWLNALKMVALASGRPSSLADRLPREHEGDALEEAARRALQDASTALGRRLLLLVDSFDEVLDRIGDDVQHARLREVLQHEPWLLLIGASSEAIEATYDYTRPLYDQLTVLELDPLTDAEALDLLAALAARDGREDLVARLRADETLIARLRLLVGGNPRTLALLYALWRDGPRGDLRQHLEILLDRHTSLYKGRLERLGRQTQRVLDALARRWEAATAEEIADELRLGRGPVSAQLTRLLERGLVERVDIGQRAVAYQVRERFFNLWFLMRGSRRSDERLRWLAEWLELFYAPEERAPARQVAGPGLSLVAALRAPGEEAALALWEAARHAPDDAALLELAGRAHDLRASQPGPWQVHAALALVEARLGRSGPAVGALADALTRGSPGSGAAPLAELCLDVARVDARGVLDALDRTGFAVRWLPLADALRVRTRRPSDHAARLPPERRALADDVLSRLDGD